MLLDFDAPAQLFGNYQSVRGQVHVEALAILPEAYRVPAVGTLEARKAGHLSGTPASYIPSESFVEPICKCLYRARWDMFAPATLEESCKSVLEKKLASFSIVLLYPCKHLIVEMAGLHQTSHKQLTLAAIRVKSVLECLQHLLRCVG